MLKIGRVYLFEKKAYYYVADKRKYKGRNTYTVHKVLADGHLGKKQFILFKRGKFKLAPNVEVDIRVILPRTTRAEINYLALVDRTRVLLLELASKKGKDSEIRKHISRNAMAATAFYNSEAGRYNNLRDFARDIGLKSPVKLYNWLAAYLSTVYTEKRYRREIPKASDGTIITSVENYTTRWKCLHGFSKKLNAIFERDMKAYLQEFKDRGLSL